MLRWLEVSAFAAILVCAAILRAGAQDVSSSTPFASLPTAPSGFPLIGGATGVPDTSDTLPLVTAAASNDIAAVSEMLDERANPDQVESYGRTALIYAAMNNNADIAQTLVSRGAKLDVRDNLGKTALHWAAERGSIAVMRLLLQAKASVDIQTRQGQTPLMLAANNGQTEAVRLLLRYHANPSINDYSGRDAISWAGDRVAIVEELKTAEAR